MMQITPHVHLGTSQLKKPLLASRRSLLAAIPLIPLISLTAAHAADFKDMPPNIDFYKEVMWATSNKYITGKANGTFDPIGSISRKTLATVFYSYWGKPDFYPPTVPYFSDVPQTHPQYAEITWSVKQNLVTGWADGTFRPDELVTRGAAAAFFYRLAGSPQYTPPAKSSFTDVPIDYLFYREISWLYDMKITSGFPSGKFLPQEPIQRDAICAFLYRIDQILG